MPIALEQAAVSSEGQAFAAQINLLGVPSQDALVLRPASNDNQTLTVEDLAPDEVYLNTEAATALGVAAGQRVHAYGLPDGAEATWTVKDVTRLGDLGGGQATIFLPLARLQDLVQRQDQVNQVLVVNSGDPAQRLSNSWPVTVELRSAFVDDATARRLFRALSSPPARDLLGASDLQPRRHRLSRGQAASPAGRSRRPRRRAEPRVPSPDSGSGRPQPPRVAPRRAPSPAATRRSPRPRPVPAVSG